MKKFVRLRSSGGWLVALLGMLGFASGCGKGEEGQRVEYGTPSAEYQVQGSVRLSGQNQPLAGVQVKVLEKSHDGRYFGSETMPRTTTDAQGAFVLAHRQFPTMVMPLEFSKPGEVLTDTVDVSFEGILLSGGTGWYLGKSSREVAFTLDPAETPAPESSESE